MHPAAVTVSLLIVSNIFMTFAWYAHLKDLGNMMSQSQVCLRGIMTGVFFGTGSGVMTTLGYLAGQIRGAISLRAPN